MATVTNRLHRPSELLVHGLTSDDLAFHLLFNSVLLAAADSTHGSSFVCEYFDIPRR